MRKSRGRGAGCGVVFNLLAALLLIMTCLSGVVYAALFVNPQLNPVAALRPPAEGGDGGLPGVPTLVPTRPPLAQGSSTPAVPTLPPAWTPTKTGTITNTPLPSNTPTETITRTPIPPTQTMTLTPSRTPTSTPTGPTPTPSNTRSAFQYTLQPGSPSYVANIDNSNGCGWFGISGQVLDLQNRSVVGLFVHMEGGGVNVDAITGSAPRYGNSGYVIFLGGSPVNSTNTYRVQLRNGAGQPISETYVIQTFQECNKNQIIVNFVQNHQ